MRASMFFFFFFFSDLADAAAAAEFYSFFGSAVVLIMDRGNFELFASNWNPEAIDLGMNRETV